MDEALIEDLFVSIRPISVRRMFGGQGIYSAGQIVAVIISGELFLKADEVSSPIFLSAGCRQWAYDRDGKAPVRMPYFTLPDEALDDPEIMRDWAILAREAAERSAMSKSKKTPSSRAKRRHTIEKSP